MEVSNAVLKFCSLPTSRTLSIVPLPMVLGFGNLAHNAVDTITHLKHCIQSLVYGEGLLFLLIYGTTVGKFGCPFSFV